MINVRSVGRITISSDHLDGVTVSFVNLGVHMLEGCDDVRLSARGNHIRTLINEKVNMIV